MGTLRCIFGIASVALIFMSFPVHAAEMLVPRPFLRDVALAPKERDRLRYELENLYNEVDLMRVNHASDEKDLKHLDQDLQRFRVYDRIPLKHDVPKLQATLRSSASRHGLKLLRFSLRPSKASPQPIPRAINNTQGAYVLRPEQVGEEIPFTLLLQGPPEAIKKWKRLWNGEQLRWVDFEPEDLKVNSPAGSRSSQPSFLMRGTAYSFRSITYPKIRLRDPITLLPPSARQDPGRFAAQEPRLWQWVERTRKLMPGLEPYYDLKREMLLKSARLNYFISKAGREPESLWQN